MKDTTNSTTKRINAAWHEKNAMPKLPTLAQRVEWHLSHAVACGCREMPCTVLVELERRGIKVP